MPAHDRRHAPHDAAPRILHLHERLVQPRVRPPRRVQHHGLHRLRELRKPDDEFGFGRKGDKQATPGEHFAALLRDGPPLGVHVIAWCDSLTNLTRAMDRQALKEFAMIVTAERIPGGLRPSDLVIFA